jgi:hypothetical protein
MRAGVKAALRTGKYLDRAHRLLMTINTRLRARRAFESLETWGRWFESQNFDFGLRQARWYKRLYQHKTVIGPYLDDAHVSLSKLKEVIRLSYRLANQATDEPLDYRGEPIHTCRTVPLEEQQRTQLRIMLTQTIRQWPYRLVSFLCAHPDYFRWFWEAPVTLSWPFWTEWPIPTGDPAVDSPALESWRNELFHRYKDWITDRISKNEWGEIECDPGLTYWQLRLFDHCAPHPSSLTTEDKAQLWLLKYTVLNHREHEQTMQEAEGEMPPSPDPFLTTERRPPSTADDWLFAEDPPPAPDSEEEQPPPLSPNL